MRNKRHTTKNLQKISTTNLLGKKPIILNIPMSLLQNKFTKAKEKMEFLLNIKKNLAKNRNQKYNSDNYSYYRLVINLILKNIYSKISCRYKEMLIYYEPSEILTRFFVISETRVKLHKLINIHLNLIKVSPNYLPIDKNISDILYKNLNEKQKLLKMIEIIENKYDKEHCGTETNSNYEPLFKSDFYDSLENEDSLVEKETYSKNPHFKMKSYRRHFNNSTKSIELLINNIKIAENDSEKQNIIIPRKKISSTNMLLQILGRNKANTTNFSKLLITSQEGNFESNEENISTSEKKFVETEIFLKRFKQKKEVEQKRSLIFEKLHNIVKNKVINKTQISFNEKFTKNIQVLPKINENKNSISNFKLNLNEVNKSNSLLRTSFNPGSTSIKPINLRSVCIFLTFS